MMVFSFRVENDLFQIVHICHKKSILVPKIKFWYSRYIRSVSAFIGVLISINPLLLPMNSEPKNYEIAYLLSPSIPEGEVLTHAGKFTTLIEGSKGVVRHVEAPKKIKLSYSVKKERNAYFGWTAFTMAPSYLADLEKKVKAQKLLRHLTIQHEEMRRVPQFRPQTVRPFKERPIPREPEKPEEKLDLEALDKRLEEILGK